MKRWLVLLMLLIQAVFAVGAEAAIQVPPKPSVSSGIYVQDYAGVLSPQTRQALNAIGQDLDNKTTAQVAVVTVKTLDGQPIDEYGLTLLRQWGLGNKEIHARKGLKKSHKILDFMGSTELAANLFRATQTDEKLRRENISEKTQANQTHFEVGRKVRQTIKELGGTMPEDLPTPEKSIKQIEHNQKKLNKE